MGWASAILRAYGYFRRLTVWTCKEVINLNVMYTRCSSWFLCLFSMNMLSNALGFIFVSKEQVSSASRIYRCDNHKLYASRCFEQAPLDVAAKMAAFWKSATLEKQYKLLRIKQGCQNGSISHSFNFCRYESSHH